MVPPYRDPELRRALALDDDAQCALLERLAGGAPAPRFQPMPPRVYRTPRGSLICIPSKLPPSAVLPPDSRELSISIEHHVLSRNRQQPRTAESIADIQEAIDEHAGKIGIVTLPFAPPRTWTVETIRKVISLMIQQLPPGLRDTGEFGAYVTKAAGFRTEDEIRVSACTKGDRGAAWRHSVDAGFIAMVRLRPAAAETAIDAWQRIFTGYWGGGRLAEIDQLLAAYAVSPAVRARPTPTAVDDDDDDLDFIERAARRRLHGSLDRLETPIEAKARRLAQVRPDEAAVIEELIERLLRQAGEK